MKVTQSPTEFLVFQVLLGRAPDIHSPGIEDWLRTRAFGRTIAPGPEWDDMLARHPLTCRVVGFASASVAFGEDAIVFDGLNASIGPEARAIETAAETLHNHRGGLMTYSGHLRALRMLARRALLLGMPAKFVLSETIARASDIADMVMYADGEITPPLEVVAEVLRLEPTRRVMAVKDLLEALRNRDHASVLKDIVWILESIAKTYSATYYGDRLPVRWKLKASSETGDNSAAGPESPPSDVAL